MSVFAAFDVGIALFKVNKVNSGIARNSNSLGPSQIGSNQTQFVKSHNFGLMWQNEAFKGLFEVEKESIQTCFNIQLFRDFQNAEKSLGRKQRDFSLFDLIQNFRTVKDTQSLGDLK